MFKKNWTKNAELWDWYLRNTLCILFFVGGSGEGAGSFSYKIPPNPAHSSQTQHFIMVLNKKDNSKLRTFIQVVQFSGENVKNFSYRIRHLSNSLNCISKSMYPRNSLSFGHFPIAVPYKMRIMSYIYHFMRCPHKLIHRINAMMNLGVMIITFVKEPQFVTVPWNSPKFFWLFPDPFV